MKRARTWILIADGSGARILEAFGSGLGYQEHAVGSGRHLSTTNAQPETTALHHGSKERRRGATKALEALFASQLSSMLAAHLRNDAFDRLVVIAPESMLQKLQKMITSEVREKVIVEIDRDLSNVPNEEISHYLDDMASISAAAT